MQTALPDYSPHADPQSDKPADLPVQLPTKFELVIQSQDGKSSVPNTLLVSAGEVIE